MSFDVYQKLIDKSTSITVIGLGYVGLPVALAFANHFKVYGFDINASRIELLNNKIDPSREISSEAFEGKDIFFTSDITTVPSSSFYIITVPTPIDVYNLPDLKNLKAASEAVGKLLKEGDYVVYESTVYPGCTEEECFPILSTASNLNVNIDFKVGYAPERLNPGDLQHTLEKNIKVVSGSDAYAVDQIALVYAQIIKAGIYKAPSIKVAEAAKIIENTQRDLNIALMNELSLIFDKMGINTYEVLDAAATKWNFQHFKPGLVGGHCIGVDPYYLTYKAKKLGYNPNVIMSGRYVNDHMGIHIAKKALQLILKQGKSIQNSKVLIMGATFKENVHDIRTSRVVDILKELISFEVEVDVYDPYADTNEFAEYYGYTLCSHVGTGYDAIIVAVAHKEFLELDEIYFTRISAEAPVLVDIKGLYKNKIKNIVYWSL